MFRFISRTRAALLMFIVLGGSGVWGCGESPAELTMGEPGFRRPASITIFPNNISFDEPGETIQFTATVNDDTGHTVPGARVYWESSDRSVLSVSSSGWVTAVATGEATITATLGAVKAKADVVVH